MSSDQQKEIRPFTFEHSFDVLMTPEEEEAAKKQEEEEAAPTFSEEELAAIAYLPMKTGYVNSDDVEEWTTLFDAFIEIEKSDHDSFVWSELLYFFTARYIENKAHGRTHTIRKNLKSDL